MSSAAYRKKWQEENREKTRAYSKRWREANPKKDLARNRRARGLPEPTRPEPEWCEGCGRLQEDSLCLDHDHTTGVFRGWLCHACNIGLGKFGDSVASVERILAYLKRAQ